MKKIQKVLAWVLAVTMLAGLCVVSAANAPAAGKENELVNPFTDVHGKDTTEAIQRLYDIGERQKLIILQQR